MDRQRWVCRCRAGHRAFISLPAVEIRVSVEEALTRCPALPTAADTRRRCFKDVGGGRYKRDTQENIRLPEQTHSQSGKGSLAQVGEFVPILQNWMHIRIFLFGGRLEEMQDFSSGHSCKQLVFTTRQLLGFALSCHFLAGARTSFSTTCKYKLELSNIDIKMQIYTCITVTSEESFESLHMMELHEVNGMSELDYGGTDLIVNRICMSATQTSLY